MSEFTPHHQPKPSKTRHRCLIILLCSSVLSVAAMAQTAEPDASAAPPPVPTAPEMIAVSGDSFLMGSPHGANEIPEHTVKISSFAISRTEITRAQYQAIVPDLPKQIAGSDTMPVTNISWLQAVQFCNALSAKDGLEAAYTIKGKQVTLDLSKNGYRLPTEAEWEYAARGGPNHSDFDYAGADRGKDISWFDENSGRVPHEVGLKNPNSLGLFDMSGNAAEWCQDWYQAYSAKTLTNPTGPVKGSFKVVRGGSWLQNENTGRVSFRTARNPKQGYPDVGFRIVLPSQG